MGKYVRSPLRGLLKILGPADPLRACALAAQTWEMDLNAAVQTHGEDMRANYIAGIREFLNNPMKQDLARRALTDWYQRLMNIAPQLAALWQRPEVREELYRAAQEALQSLGGLQAILQTGQRRPGPAV